MATISGVNDNRNDKIKPESTLLASILLNPFFVYSLIIIISLIFYSFGWSSYPRLSNTLLFFLLSSSLLSFFLGRKLSIPAYNIKITKEDKRFWRFSVFSAIALSCGFLCIYVYGGIPFYKILLSSQKYHYKDFNGIPYLSTISMYGMSAFMTVWFSIFLKSRQRKYLWLIGVGAVNVVLMSSRGYAMLVLMPGVLIYLYYVKLNLKKILGLLGLALIGLYLFGLFGDYRESAKTRTSQSGFYENYQSDKFPDFLPREFFWGYFYFTSPIAKMQFTLGDDSLSELENNYVALTIFELMPYSFGNRINKVLNMEERVSEHGFPSWFVGTAYYGPYLYAKWVGVVIFTLCFFTLSYLIIMIAQRYLGDFAIPVYASMSLFMALSIFDNMVAFAPINFQIMACVVIGIVRVKQN